MSKAWYVVHTYSGYENKAKFALEERIKSLGRDGWFGEILVPQEQVIEVRDGKKRTTTRKFFPGYMLVQMEYNNETYHIVKNTPKVTGFVGGGDNTPPPQIPEEEVDRITNQVLEGAEAPKPLLEFDKGEQVRVVDGPFAGFNGNVDEGRPEKGKLRVMVSFFGRSTPVVLEFTLVEKT